MGDGGGFRTPCADFSRPVEELEYSCLLKSTFTQVSHDRDFRTCQTPVTYPECIFCGRKYRWGAVYVECHMDPNISKTTTDKERVVAASAESQSTSRGPNRTRFLAVQAAIRAKMQCDKKSLLAAADASKQHNLMVVGGHSDNAVDLCGEDNADAKCQCLDDNADAKRQCLVVKSPSETRYGSRVTMSERMINTKRIYDMAPV